MSRFQEQSNADTIHFTISARTGSKEVRDCAAYIIPAPQKNGYIVVGELSKLHLGRLAATVAEILNSAGLCTLTDDDLTGLEVYGLNTTATQILTKSSDVESFSGFAFDCVIPEGQPQFLFTRMDLLAILSMKKSGLARVIREHMYPQSKYQHFLEQYFYKLDE